VVKCNDIKKAAYVAARKIAEVIMVSDYFYL